MTAIACVRWDCFPTRWFHGSSTSCFTLLCKCLRGPSVSGHSRRKCCKSSGTSPPNPLQNARKLRMSGGPTLARSPPRRPSPPDQRRITKRDVERGTLGEVNSPARQDPAPNRFAKSTGKWQRLECASAALTKRAQSSSRALVKEARNSLWWSRIGGMLSLPVTPRRSREAW